ncbi:GvpL/GvpF family gas vesicle protein [Virgibacillus flavescens]|uniref:GvpL/GvpF family gas vesicle protein n=1 Tax=Virgibacillus flavescens TaxID=1611422 RepID=UPI003D357375
MGNLFYLYGIIPKKETETTPLPQLAGIDEKPIYTLSIGSVEAVVCDIRESEFNEQALEEKMTNAEWLQVKAFHHHEMLMTLHESYTVIPMKFCTIYESNASLREKLESFTDSMAASLDFLSDKEEWNLKIYCDNTMLRTSIEEHSLTIDEKKKEIESLSPGRQFLEKKKLDKIIDQEADKEKEYFSAGLHDELKASSIKNEVKKNWNKDVTGRSEEMCWNSVYLIQESDTEGFLAKLKALKEKYEASGWQLELTGPWPAYHFAKLA